MLKDKRGYFIHNKLYAVKINEKTTQLNITIPKKDWKYFPVNSRARIFSIKGIDIVKKVNSMGGGKQRTIRIPIGDNDIFSKGDIIRVYPLNQPQKVSKSQQEKEVINKQKNDEQTTTKKEI